MMVWDCFAALELGKCANEITYSQNQKIISGNVQMLISSELMGHSIDNVKEPKQICMTNISSLPFTWLKVW